MYLEALSRLVDDRGGLMEKHGVHLISAAHLLAKPEKHAVLENALRSADEGMRKGAYGKVLIEAAKAGHIETIDFVVDLMKELDGDDYPASLLDDGMDEDIVYNALDYVSWNGTPEAATALIHLQLTLGKDQQPLAEYADARNVKGYAEYGRMDILKTILPILEQTLPREDFERELFSAWSYAIEGGQRETRDYFFSKISGLENGVSELQEHIINEFNKTVDSAAFYEDFNPTKYADEEDNAKDFDHSDVALELIETLHRLGGEEAVGRLARSASIPALFKRVYDHPYLFNQRIADRVCSDIEKYGGASLLHDMMTSDEMQDVFNEVCSTGHPIAIEDFITRMFTAQERAKVNDIDRIIDTFINNDLMPLRNAVASGNENGILTLLEWLPNYTFSDAFAVLPEEMRSAFGDRVPDIKEFWLEKGSGDRRWYNLTHSPPPDDSLSDKSPYKFKPKLYEELLPVMQTAAELEGNKGAELHAYKLAVLFASAQEADQYITKYAKEWSEGKNSQVVHDACLFELPERGMWDVNKWKPLVLKHGPAVTKYLEMAPKIEKIIEASGQPFPKTAREMRFLVETQMAFERGYENPQLAALAIEYGLSEERFNDALDVLKEAKETDQLPQTFIDGADIGHPNYYMAKLECSDPKGLLLGEITNNCQSIGKQGDECVRHGMTSENGGFYVWKRKTKGKITGKDKIIAQSWAWLSPDGAMVFDSFERLDSVYNKLAQPFLEQFAHEVTVNNPHSYEVREENRPSADISLKAITLGTGGYTPPNIHLPNPDSLPEPVDYEGYRDSRPWTQVPHWSQFIIPAVDHASMPDKQLPPPKDGKKVELEARNYIRRTLKKFKEQYGITVQTGIELEFFAIGKDGEPTSEILDLDTAKANLASYEGVGRIEHENEQERKGQYEVVIGANASKSGKVIENTEPTSVASSAEEVRKHLQDTAEDYGLSAMSFESRPYEDREASGAHISVSLWDEDNQPLFGLENDSSINPLMQVVAKGMLEMQRPLTLLFAPNDDAYKRFGNTEWSPNIIALSDTGRTGKSLRLASSKGMSRADLEAGLRIENRLPASDSNYIVSMAATIAGIDNALSRYVSVVGEDGAEKYNADEYDIVESGSRKLAVDKEALKKFGTQALPQNRYDAAEAFKAGADNANVSNIIGDSFVSAVMKQHQLEKPVQQGKAK